MGDAPPSCWVLSTSRDQDLRLGQLVGKPVCVLKESFSTVTCGAFLWRFHWDEASLDLCAFMEVWPSLSRYTVTGVLHPVLTVTLRGGPIPSSQGRSGFPRTRPCVPEDPGARTSPHCRLRGPELRPEAWALGREPRFSLSSPRDSARNPAVAVPQRVGLVSPLLGPCGVPWALCPAPQTASGLPVSPFYSCLEQLMQCPAALQI